jgi:DNA-directed RNA polymerase specialized sigma24 family protein
MSRTHSEELVDVIIAEMHLRLMSIPDLSIINSPSAYLNCLASSLLINHYRHHQRIQERFHEQPVDEMEDHRALPPCPNKSITNNYWTITNKP